MKHFGNIWASIVVKKFLPTWLQGNRKLLVLMILCSSQHCLFWCFMDQSTLFVLMLYVSVDIVCFDALCTSQQCLFWCSMYQSTLFFDAVCTSQQCFFMQYVPVNIVCFDVYVLVNTVCFDSLCISQHCLFLCFMYQSTLFVLMLYVPVNIVCFDALCTIQHCFFLVLHVPVNNFSVFSGWFPVSLGWTSTK